MGNIKECPGCKSSFGIFRWRYNCDCCNVVYCDDCLQKPSFYWLTYNPVEIMDYCPRCWSTEIAELVKKYNEALTDSNNIESFSHRYKGKIGLDSKKEQKNLKSEWFKDKDDAEKQLKITASFLDLDIIYNFKVEHRTDNEDSDNGKGTYYYKVFSASGTAAKKK